MKNVNRLHCGRVRSQFHNVKFYVCFSVFSPLFVVLANTHTPRARTTVHTAFRSHRNEMDTCTCRRTFCVKTNFCTNFPVSRGNATTLYGERTTKRRRDPRERECVYLGQSNNNNNKIERKNKYDANTETISHRNKFIRSAIQRTCTAHSTGSDGKRDEKFVDLCSRVRKMRIYWPMLVVGTSQTLQTEECQRNECDTHTHTHSPKTAEVVATQRKYLCIIFQYIFAPSFGLPPFLSRPCSFFFLIYLIGLIVHISL